MDNINKSSFELIYAIVDYGKGSKILHKAKDYGINGGTIILAKGTITNSILNFLSLYDESKEMVLLGTDSETAKKVMTKLNSDFHFEKPGKGIIFSTKIFKIVGSRQYGYERKIEKGVDEKMYKNIITIVNRGKAEDVIEAAKKAGSKGGTIINARGSGINDTIKLFNMDIEPEKEMVIILAKENIADAIVDAISEKLEIKEHGNGIIFVQDISRVYGVYE